MFSDEKIASLASLSMILEVSTTPKIGNVHRMSNFLDTTYEHFLSTAVFSEHTFLKALTKQKSIGDLLYLVISKTISNQNGLNTYFGTYLLLFPICQAVFKIKKNHKIFNINELKKEIKNVCKNTTIKDTILFKKSIFKANVFLNSSKSKYNLLNPLFEELISKEKITLYKLMIQSKKTDLIALEWISGFKKTFLFSSRLFKNYNYYKINKSCTYLSVINSAILYTFLQEIKKNID